MLLVPLRILASDCNERRELKLSSLLRMIEEISIADTTRLHMGREKTLDQGLLWVISRLVIKIDRLPLYDESVQLITYPEKREHVLFPRYYVLKNPLGKTLAEAEALWTLIDQRTRKPVNPTEHGIVIRAFPFSKESDLNPLIHPLSIQEYSERKVLPSELDLNGHLTNTRYADWYVDLYGDRYSNKHLVSFALAFEREARVGETLSLGSGAEGNDVYLAGSLLGKNVFEILARYQ